MVLICLSSALTNALYRLWYGDITIDVGFGLMRIFDVTNEIRIGIGNVNDVDDCTSTLGLLEFQ